MEIGGFDAATIVSQLMQIERMPLTNLQARRDAAKVAADAYGKIRSEVDAFRLAAAKLSTSSSWQRYTATSSSSSAGVSVTGSAVPGSFSFSVDRLASSHGLRSQHTVASSSVAVVTDPVLAVAAGTRTVGIGTVRAGTGLGVGEVSLSVTRASAPAVTVGTSAPDVSTTIDGTVDITVNGVPTTVTFAGSYTVQGLADALDAALDGIGGIASLGTSGAIELSTVRHGTGARIEITGGSAVAALGLVAGASAGVDGIIEVGGVTNTITSIEDGASCGVDTGSGVLDITFSGGLEVGTADVTVVSTGDRSLTAVASAINGAGAGVSAAAVKVADGAWRLQLNGRSTGADGNIAIDASVFDSLGGLVETSVAGNARLTVGTGVGAYTIEASGNTFTDVMPGVTITAASVSESPVAVTVARNDAALTADVSALVNAANAILADIKVQTRFDATTKARGPLAGDGTVRQLADQVRRALADVVGGASVGIPSQLGIEIQKDGTFAFDSAEFAAAITADPARVAEMFARSGVATGPVAFATAGELTAAGTYDVVVTTAATRADSGLLDGSALAGKRIGVRAGDVTVEIDVAIGRTDQEIVDACNTALADAGLDVIAETASGGGVRLHAGAWGSAGDFDLNTDVGSFPDAWTSTTGTDVVGTIDGVAATGVGRRLTLATTAATSAAGLAVDVDGGVASAGDGSGGFAPVGAIEYVPGIAARVVRFASSSIDADNGSLASAKDAAQRRIDDFDDQIDRFEDRMIVREDRLTREFAAMQTLLSQLQSQGSWLSSQISTMSYSWGSG